MATEEKRMRQRGDTAANWSAANPTLAKYELGIEQDADGSNTKFKIGDGITAWNSLGYWVSDGGGGGAGTVTTVNNLVPDEAGNVALLADDIPFVPNGNIASSDLQLAVVEVRDEAATALTSHSGEVGEGAHLPAAVTEGHVLTVNASGEWVASGTVVAAAAVMIWDDVNDQYVIKFGNPTTAPEREWRGPVPPVESTGPYAALWEEGDVYLDTSI